MLMNQMKTKDTFTENEMPSNSSSFDACLDFFAIAGSCRSWSDDQIIANFSKAMAEDPLTALKILFFARDIRGGMGERRVFNVCSKYLDDTLEYRDHLYENLNLIPEYGRWKDIFHLRSSKVLSLIRQGLDDGNGLLAKWLPRKGPFAEKVRKFLGLTPKEYRKKIVALTKVVEQQMCAKDWSNIKYDNVPSIAMNKYRRAFLRNDNARFSSYIEQVKKGKKSINAGDLFPYQLYQAYQRNEDKNAVEAQWENLPNFLEGNTKRILPVCDTSGSMYCLGNPKPIDVSVSLGIYISERNEGIFKDGFLTFSRSPKLQYLKGSFYDRCRQLEKAEWGMNTDIEAIFDLILKSAERGNVPEDQMPDTIMIISDMQFDRCVNYPDDSSLDMIKKRYNKFGYEIPSIIFWNVNARKNNLPVKYDDRGVCIVSGCSPSIFKSVLSGDIVDPRSVMMEVVNSERYKPIKLANQKNEKSTDEEVFNMF